MPTETQPLTGIAGGVPYVVSPPTDDVRASAPVVLAFHMLDPPRSERALAAALPLHGLPAFRIYLGLPLSGSRLPAGGLQELMQRVYSDVVLEVQQPVVSQALEELPGALEVLRQRFGFREGPLGVLGGSIGGAIAQLVLTDTGLDVRAAVLVNPLIQLRQAIDALGKRHGITYPWSEPSLAAARRLDFVARAAEISARASALLLLIGEDDDQEAIRAPAQRLYEGLRRDPQDPTKLALCNVPGLAHALAGEPGIDPAPQTGSAAHVDRLAVDWFRRHLCEPHS